MRPPDCSRNRTPTGVALDASRRGQEIGTEFVELMLAHSGGKDGRRIGIPPLPASRRKAAPPDQPGWADGLRQLYDSVLDEQLPESFDDLLKRLDQAGHG